MSKQAWSSISKIGDINLPKIAGIYQDDQDEVEQKVEKVVVAHRKKKEGVHVMNIHHFEQLQSTFENHKNEDGSSGFDIDKFREVFKNVLGDTNITFDQMTLLFMKIDANSDGTVDWDEFSGYMMAGSMESDGLALIFDDRVKRLLGSPHRDMIKIIDFIFKERKYLSVGRDGTICLWNQNLKLQKVMYTKDFFPQMSWVADALFVQEFNKLIIVTDNRQLCIYDILSIKPRLLCAISQLEHNPLCLAHASNYEEESDLILFGDDGGFLNVITLRRSFFENTSDTIQYEHLTAAKLTKVEDKETKTWRKLSKEESMKKYNLFFYRRKIHYDWILKIQYIHEINAFITCSSETNRSLAIGDLERKTERHVSVPKGIKCFEYCRRPSFLVTGGRDKVVIKIWNARNLNCLQTLMDKVSHRPENIISSMFYDHQNQQLITGSSKLEPWPLYKNLRRSDTQMEDSSVVSAIYNENFRQVVSGTQSGSITIWDLESGEKIFQFHNAHDSYELTAMCFDKSGRRLITGSRDGIIKMWNFNNGMILKKMQKETMDECTGLMYVEMGSNKYIIAIGWDNKIYIFIDDIDKFECGPARVLNGKGTLTHRGHEDDLSSVSFCPPNIVATSSVDGAIVLWNIESGYIKLTLRDPFLDLRARDEKAVEKVLFLIKQDMFQNYQLSSWPRVPLISSHADGHIRFWEIQEGNLICELNCSRGNEEEGMNTMITDIDATILIVGGSKGYIRVYDVRSFSVDMKKDYSTGCVLKSYWRAHVWSIASLGYANSQELVITASRDSTIRVWTINGNHIGVFGGDVSWYIDDPSTYAHVPEDLRMEAELIKQRNQLLEKQNESIKKNVINNWRGIAVELGGSTTNNGKNEETAEEMNARLMALRKRNLQTHVIQKWNDHATSKKKVRGQIKVSYDAVYSKLKVKDLEDIPTYQPPASLSLNKNNFSGNKFVKNNFNLLSMDIGGANSGTNRNFQLDSKLKNVKGKRN
ncbi:WD40 repeat domain 95 [Clydaea vesicula]|uniref:WD40 repeat domain 95 n=1 Tax=Clydaea vesicula TaxID=447962 RepID=A0AAD5UAQ0_9FUNG|nr:WD40 repeat domain 95 [Clydaea vesicula]